ncbi:hypothetical protein CTEN210_12998 [Chaetoceros tenuissimus]|uniref:LNR domain-containing protein n=1 Tax=Chaetoceros tenuissimus TaxID=426638 RepID=A0AAD3HAD3_9STRA|nr:hypothetical protein CTEN210_12998 [Chaetoceros tenuissimus]
MDNVTVENTTRKNAVLMGEQDCTIAEYPDCRVDSPHYIGDGECEGGAYNTEECSFDGGDCLEFNTKYPDCKVDYPIYIGDGLCFDNIESYNTEECGFDCGDCDEYNLYKFWIEKYPDCRVDDYSKLGDVECHKNYNMKACGWDGGDCQSPKKYGIIFGATAATAIGLIIGYLLFRTFYLVPRRQRQSNIEDEKVNDVTEEQL